MRHFRAHPRARGFSLLEVLLALGLAMLVGTLAITKVKRDVETAQAQAAGQQIAQLGSALNQYIGLYFPKIASLTTSTANTADDPGSRTCSAAGTYPGYCYITLDTLRYAGLVPASFTPQNVFGAYYSLLLRVQSPSSAVFAVDGLVTTQTPYLAGTSTPRFDLLGEAMLTAGADAGMVRMTPTGGNVLFEGLNGGWTESGFSSVMADVTGQSTTQSGLLGMRAGYGSGGYAAFLRLDGGNAMTGDLKMNNNKVILGTASATQVGLSAITGSTTPRVGLSQNSDLAGEYTGSLQGGTLLATSYLEAGSATVAGKLLLDAGNNITGDTSPGSVPTLIGTHISATGRNAVSTNTSTDLMSGANTDILSSRDLSAGRYLSLKNPDGTDADTVALHGDCSGFRNAIARVNDRQLVQCQYTNTSALGAGYTWETFSTPSRIYHRVGTTVSGGTSTALCTSGELAIGGGFAITSATGTPPRYNGPYPQSATAAFASPTAISGWVAQFFSGTTGYATVSCMSVY